MWLQILVGIFFILHGLVHWVYAAPMEKEPEPKAFNALTGRWLVKKAGVKAKTALTSGIVLMSLTTVGFIVSAIALFCSAAWWTIPATATAVVSLAFIILYWEKWMFGGALLNIAVIVLAQLWEI